MPNRLETCFSHLRDSDRCALVTYITAGDPSGQATLAVMRTLAEAGVDVIELGVPFSDPMADGPVIQRASQRALENGMSLRGVLDLVTEFRRDYETLPIVLMGYLNPIEAMGYETFSTQASAAGVDGVLIVDAPPEESAAINNTMARSGLDQIFLIAPNSTAERIGTVRAMARGFVYYVSVKGVTGSKSIDAEEVRDRINSLREALPLPVGVGFGIKSAPAAAAVAVCADAVIVGSSIIEIIERHANAMETMQKEVGVFVSQLRAAIDHARAA